MSKTKKRYEEKRIAKRVSFNTENSDDRIRLEFANTINFSKWVKRKIDDELNPTTPPPPHA